MARRKVLRANGSFYFEFPSSAGVFPQNMTIIACCPPITSGQGIFSKGVNTQFQLAGNAFLTRFYAAAGASVQVSLANIPSDVQWRSVTYNGTTGAAEIFHGSASVATATTATKPATNGDSVRLFRWGALIYSGSLFEFAWYHEILTPTQISDFIAGNYNYTNCYCHYKCDEGSGNVIHDSSGNSRDLTATGTAVWEDIPITLGGSSRPSHPLLQQVIG